MATVAHQTKLQKYLKKRRISVYSIAQKANIEYTRLWRMVNGKTKHATLKDIIAVARALKVRISDIADV